MHTEMHTTIENPCKYKGFDGAWEYKCDCSKTVYVTSSDLAVGKKTSCGCDAGKRLGKQ